MTAQLPGLLVPLHLGALHPVEQAITIALAFGPFLLLALVVVIRRRQDRRETLPDAGAPDADAPDLGAPDPDQRDR